MKKIIAVVLALVLVLGLAACGNSGNQVIKNNNTNTAPAQNNTAPSNSGTNTNAGTGNSGANTAAKGENVDFNGQNVFPGNAFDSSKVSEKATTMEVPSCALAGTDTIYTYNDVEITVSEYKGEKVIYSTYFNGTSVKTEKGISIGSSKADMEKAYGTGYKNVGTQYEYNLETAVLTFIIENDKVTSIYYTLVIE